MHHDILIDNVSCPMNNVLFFRLTKYNVYVIVVYRPPSYSNAQNQELIDVLNEVTRDREAVVIGDFKLPGLNWGSCGGALADQGSPMERQFFDTFNSIGLTQWVNDTTFPRSGNILDLLLTTEPDRVGDISIEPPFPGSDHCPIVFDYVFEDQDVLHDPVPNRMLWHKGDYSKLRTALSCVDWEFELAYLNSCESFERFVSIVTDLATEYVPSKPPSTGRISPPWRVRPPGALTRQRRDAWHDYKTARSRSGRRSSAAAEAFAVFSLLNRQC